MTESYSKVVIGGSAFFLILLKLPKVALKFQLGIFRLIYTRNLEFLHEQPSLRHFDSFHSRS